MEVAPSIFISTQRNKMSKWVSTAICAEPRHTQRLPMQGDGHQSKRRIFVPACAKRKNRWWKRLKHHIWKLPPSEKSVLGQRPGPAKSTVVRSHSIMSSPASRTTLWAMASHSRASDTGRAAWAETPINNPHNRRAWAAHSGTYWTTVDSNNVRTSNRFPDSRAMGDKSIRST